MLQKQSCKILFIKILPDYTTYATELLIFPSGVLTLLLTAAHTQLLSRGYPLMDEIPLVDRNDDTLKYHTDARPETSGNMTIPHK